jgi:hypothetical protein
VAENYGEYVDYNSITTQSDRGEMLYTLLDFLRLRANYDRRAWHLRPVVLAHRALVRAGRDAAAEIWRHAVARRTALTADEYRFHFDELCEKYGMRLPSIAERLAERFVRPLEIDRLCALIPPAVAELRDDLPHKAIKELEERIDRFTQEPLGAGFELPSWLDALEREVDQVQWEGDGDEDETQDPNIRFPHVLLTRAEVQRQLKEMVEGEKE